jgi:hypothetical protein
LVAVGPELAEVQLLDSQWEVKAWLLFELAQNSLESVVALVALGYYW